MFAPVTQLVEELSLKILLTLNVEKSLICVVGAPIFSLEDVNRNKSQDFVAGMKRFKM
jgi:hypothetical protein